MECLLEAFRLSKSISSDIRNVRDIAGYSGQQLLTISGFGYLRCLDLLLARTALSKLQRVECAGHFDVYTALISELRQAGVITHFSGVQHGLFEFFRFGEPTRLFFDEYQLLFGESKTYFERHLSANPDCIFRLRGKKPAFDHCADFGGAVAVALQNDDEASDARLLDKLQSTAGGRLVLLAYVHPTTKARGLARLRARFPDIRFEPTLRCANIAVVITRYSTLAMDYVSLGVPAIFWASPDRVCVSFSGHPLINEVTDLDALPRILDSILSQQGNFSS